MIPSDGPVPRQSEGCSLLGKCYLENTMKSKVVIFLEKVQDYTVIQAMRRGLVSLIPILMIGSFSVLFSTFPVFGYVDFITTWCDGFIYNLFDTVQKVTFGMLSVYMAGIVGYHMGIMDRNVEPEKRYGTMLVSLGSFFVLSGAVDGTYDAFGVKGMFVAIVAAGIASELYLWVAKRMKGRQILADGADMHLISAIRTIFPAVLSFIVIVLTNNIIMKIAGQESFYALMHSLMEAFVDTVGTGFIAVFVYVLLGCILWFFGIHGSDVLDSVAESIFQPATQQNLVLVQSGQMPTQILTKQLVDCFVLIGGCGATICLMIALLIFSKRKGTRNLMKVSVIPMLFNINEILVFGLPIIYNPLFLAPFLVVPVVCLCISYVAVSTGLVPMVTTDIQWTTPILINSYLFSGSWKGVALQLVNLTVGVGIYAPFVKLYDKKKDEASKKNYDLMVQRLKESEASGSPIALTDSTLSYGWMGKALAADLEYAFAHKEFKLFYQPQYNDNDECIGAEALLRWKHPSLGWIYPPLIFKLAEETGNREKLERWVLLSVLSEARMLQDRFSDSHLKISANVTGASIQQKSFEDFLQKVAKENDIKKLNICLEITEQDALLLDETLRERFLHLRKLGYMLAVDDFSMGSTSIKYLTDSHFELVKLDGSLVKGILDNPRCVEIIASIVRLSDSLGVQVLAEYVSDAQIREKLLKVGCRLYQGWYYSPAIPLEEFVDLIEKEKK